MEKIEATIAALEDEQEKLHARFSEETLYQHPDQLHALQEKLAAHKHELARWYEAWEFRLG